MRYLALGAVGGMGAGALLTLVFMWSSGSTYEWVDSVVGTSLMGLLPGVAVGAIVMVRKEDRQ
ncbi:hypothetical protein [Kineococcus radiotolerans]|uniref:hypothetical protein n=1 Tax=Kineococcus radiotolerans TaxID=131568 RepID=UPI000324FC5E|nr:hypothetical protein [Kineococcus radiotolerans]